MSTRGCIARLQRRDPLEFKGVYHHWDSYPSGLGKTLFEMRNQAFKGDTAAMLKLLIDEHPAGWSTVVGKDFTLDPGFCGTRTPGNDEANNTRPECYCHGDRHETGLPVTQDNAAAGGIEYAYVFDGPKVLVLSSLCRDGAKMVGMFGIGDPNAVWSVIAEVDLKGPEPDWKALDHAGSQDAVIGAQIACTAVEKRSRRARIHEVPVGRDRVL